MSAKDERRDLPFQEHHLFMEGAMSKKRGSRRIESGALPQNQQWYKISSLLHSSYSRWRGMTSYRADEDAIKPSSPVIKANAGVTL